MALPTIADFGFTREIDDWLLAPVMVRLVALEKVLFEVFHGLVAALVVLLVAARAALGRAREPSRLCRRRPACSAHGPVCPYRLLATVMALAALMAAFWLWGARTFEPRVVS